MRVRISFDALRLCLLVAAGVTSGYLWRAAFESSSPETRLAGRPEMVDDPRVCDVAARSRRNGELYALVTNTPSNGTGGIVYRLGLVPEPAASGVAGVALALALLRRRRRA